MKNSDYPRLKTILTALLPIHQVKAWNVMQISHQDLSDVVLIMLKEGLIKRTPTKFKGSHTYLLESLNHKPQKIKDFSPMISGMSFSPCAGCAQDCLPAHCAKLTSWVTNTQMEKI